MIATQRFVSKAASPLPGVSADAWERFHRVLDVQPAGAISESGGFGSYDIRPRRLVELGYATGLHATRTAAGRQVYECEFVLPWTRAKFLADMIFQNKVFAQSMVLYHRALTAEQLKRSKGCSMAGALVVLHRGGRGALEAWPKLFEETKALYEVAQGAF